MPDQREDIFEEEEINLIQYVNVLLKRRWMIIVGVFLCVLLTGIYSKRQSPVYKAYAQFLPSKDPDMTSRMGTLIGGGRVESFESNVTSEYYAELLKRSMFLERIANRKFNSKRYGKEVDLFSFYEIEADNETERLVKVYNAIKGSLEVSTHRTTKVITISYSTGEPELSAAITNAFIDELIKYNRDVRDSKAGRNLKFIEGQLNDNRKLLKDAESSLANFAAKNRIIASPDLEVEKDRLERNVKIQEEVYTTLKKQLELAKIEEQEEKPVIEILESAAPPLYKSSPKTRKNVILAGLVSLFLFVGLAFVMEYISKINPEDEKNKEFYKYLGDIKKELLIVTRIFKKKAG